MTEHIRFVSDEVQQFINKNQSVIDMCKREAWEYAQQCEEHTKNKAQNAIGKTQLASAIGLLNAKTTKTHKEYLENALKQIPNITQEIIDAIIFNA